MQRKAQQNQMQSDPREGQVEQAQAQINANQAKPITSTKQIITSLNLLMADPDYGTQHQALLSNMKNEYIKLLSSLENGVLKEASIKVAQKVEMPPAPSPDYENATNLYERMLQQMETLKGQLNSQVQRYNQIQPIIEQSSAQHADWANKFMPQAQAWKETKETAFDLDLTNKRASHKTAYPQTPKWKPSMEQPDLDKWKKTATRMQAFSRVYGGSYTFPQVLYHFTKDWNMFDRYDFKKWYLWNFKKNASNDKLKKVAYADSVGQDRMSQFTKKRKRLLSRIGLTRKALMDLINDGLVAQENSNKIYKLISMLEFEAMKLQMPKVAAARLRRASAQMKKLGFSYGGKVLKEAAEELLNPAIVKTAEADKGQAVGLLRRIKKEMDTLSYSRHLDELFYIKKELEKMGRAGDAEQVEKIIRDDLDVLEKLNKKLTEVYTNLSKVPLELTEDEDKFTEETPERVEKMPLEVSEEDVKTPPAPKLEEKPKRPTPPQRPTPRLERDIPNV